MSRLTTTLGYAFAGLTIAAVVATPLALLRRFVGAVAGTGIRVDPVYTGGEIARTISADRPYIIQVHRPVLKRAPLQSTEPFVQIDWMPIAALPEHVGDPIDIDGDGTPDLMVSFHVPPNDQPLRVDVRPLGPLVRAMNGVSRDSLGSLIARLPDRIVVRVPLASGQAWPGGTAEARSGR